MTAHDESGQPAARIRWWWVLAGGFLIELFLTIASVPFFVSGREADLQVVVPPGDSGIRGAVRRVYRAQGQREIRPPRGSGGWGSLSDLVVLLVGNVLFAPMEPDLSASLSPSYLASHVLKVLGGALGGYWLARRRAG